MWMTHVSRLYCSGNYKCCIQIALERLTAATQLLAAMEIGLVQLVVVIVIAFIFIFTLPVYFYVIRKVLAKRNGKACSLI